MKLLVKSLLEGYENHPDPSGMLKSAHSPDNTLLVWWYDPENGRLIKTTTPTWSHQKDLASGRVDNNAIYSLARGRVFKYGDKIYMMYYWARLRKLSEPARIDMFDKVQNSVGLENVITGIVDDNGDNIGDLFECYGKPLETGKLSIKG